MRFLSIEYAIPSKQVTNEEIVRKILKKSSPHFSNKALTVLEDSFYKLFKISQTNIRYHRDTNEKSYSFGIAAGKKALQVSGIAPEEIDLLLYVGVGRGFLEPATANVFLDLLNLKNATCFDILDACASWIRAIHVAQAFLKTGLYKNIMILNCEFNFQEYANFEFRSMEEVSSNFATFTIGEAATATIVTHSREDDEYYTTFKSWGNKHNLCKIPLPHLDQYSDREKKSGIVPLHFFSYGQEMFAFIFQEITKQYFADEKLISFEQDIVFGHAASDTLCESVSEACHLGKEKGFFIHKTHGNTVSASVPLAMALAKESGRLVNGANMLIGFGSAGITSSWTKLKYLNNN
jgi:3-oxoacyl-[acyl-carrier-protein] synthase III